MNPPNRGYAIKEAEEEPPKKDLMDPDQNQDPSKRKVFGFVLESKISNIQPKLFNMVYIGSLVMKNNLLVSLPPEINKLVNLKHLDITNNQIRYLPPEIGDLVQLTELLIGHNGMSTLPFQLGKLFNLEILRLEGNYFDQELLNLYQSEDGINRLLCFLLDELCEKIAPLPEREFIRVNHVNNSRPSCIFTVMSYNVLCHHYATQKQYGYCPTWALKWDYRKEHIMNQIKHYNADIITLQEIETEAFSNFFLKELQPLGYTAIFSPKSRSKFKNLEEQKEVDGCAIFYKPSKFTLVQHNTIVFNEVCSAMTNYQAEKENLYPKERENMCNRVMPHDNIAMTALLRINPEAWVDNVTDNTTQDQYVMVVTAHLHWDPNYCDVKMIQTIVLMAEVRKIIKAYTEAVYPNLDSNLIPENICPLICGDFNSTPTSGVVEFLQNSRVSMDHPDFKGLTYTNSLVSLYKEGVHQEKRLVMHPMNLASAYDEYTMPMSNITYEFKNTIDYIFYNTDRVQNLGVLGSIPQEWFKENKIVGCPNPLIPSDHLPLLVQLQLWPGTQTRYNNTGMGGRNNQKNKNGGNPRR